MTNADEKAAVLKQIWLYHDEHVPPETRTANLRDVFAKRRRRYERMSLATLRENLAKLELVYGKKEETSTTTGLFEIEWPEGFLVTAKVLEDTMSRYWNLPVQVREVPAPGQVVVEGHLEWKWRIHECARLLLNGSPLEDNLGGLRVQRNHVYDQKAHDDYGRVRITIQQLDTPEEKHSGDEGKGSNDV